MGRFVYLIGFVIAGFLALGMFQAKTGASQSAQRIRELKTEIAKLDAEIAVLEREYDALAAPERIADLAARELGMGPARSYQLIDNAQAERAFGPLKDYGEFDD